MSISVRLPLLFISSILVIIAAVCFLVYYRFEKRMIDEYTAMGASATIMMTREFDPDKVPMYLEENFELEEYNTIRQNLVFLKEHYPDVMYMYIYHFIPEGGEVIFDLDSDFSLDADPPGTLYDPDPAVVPYMDELCAGEQIPVLTGDTDDGYMLTYMRPVYYSNGDYCCHVCVDFSMEDVHKKDILFVLSMLIVLGITMIVIVLIDVHVMKVTVTGPINRMKHATDSFSYKDESDHQKNINVMEELKIHTGDEIEDIYQLFIAFMKNNLTYMKNLSKAESDIKDKDAKIGQISEEAYKDTLTNVGSKAAYKKDVAEINKLISSGTHSFAVVMVDVNDLKKINDEYGHEAGDTYIKGSCSMICEVFKHSPVYRIGGDEFVVILSSRDYENRDDLKTELENAFAESFGKTDCDPWFRYSASVGMSENTEDDTDFESVFKRADQDMYEAKKEFKKKHGSYR